MLTVDNLLLWGALVSTIIGAAGCFHLLITLVAAGDHLRFQLMALLSMCVCLWYVMGYIGIIAGVAEQSVVAVRWFRPATPFLFGTIFVLTWYASRVLHKRREDAVSYAQRSSEILQEINSLLRTTLDQNG